MGLKTTLSSLEGLPEAISSLYQQVGDVYVLQLEDNNFSQKLGEFRDQNIDLLKTNDGLKTKLEGLAGFDGLDAEEVREALATLQKQKDNKMISEGKLEELLGQRTDKMRSDYDGKMLSLEQIIEKQTARGDMFEKRYSTTVIDAQIQNAVSEVASVRPGAMTDVLARARRVWSVNEDGDLLPQRDGKVMYGADGKDPISMIFIRTKHRRELLW